MSHAYHDSEADIWDWYTRGFGPLKQLAAHYRTDLGLHVAREYLLVRGVRR